MGNDFNKIRGVHPQPLIMDSLLETIDSLRLLQKNYEENRSLFSFDYKKDLYKIATERDRVFKLEQLEPEEDDEDVDPAFMETLGFMTAQRKDAALGAAAAARMAN